MNPVPWPVATDDLDRWVDLVARHPIWQLAAGDPARDAVRRYCTELAVHLAWTRRSGLFPLADDPWQDLAFARRLLHRLAWLLEHAGAPASGPARHSGPLHTFSAAEAGLLLSVPLLYDALWSGLAAAARGVRPHDLTPSQDASSDRAAFERFAQSYAQPYRRALAAVARGRHDAAEEIGWWLLHRWVGRQPAAYQPDSLTGLLEPVAGDRVFEPARLTQLMWALRADPGFLARTDRVGALTARAPDGVRERLVGYLLVAARSLAIEAVALPEVVAEHLAIVDPVAPAALRETIEAITWQRRGTALVLTAVCSHPAEEVALRSHVDTVNQVLTEIQRAAAGADALAPLSTLPTHVITDGVRPAEVDGVRAYQSAGVRFRLAEDRVQELLMGEQLYGDPALAIRELYQNALDACRYREARTEYLRRTRDQETTWDGQIRFEQGVDEQGRPFLDCSDNGIGMGVRELSDVFAQAGVRLGDLPEFLEEQAEWARLDPPVQLFPNSRFGIGVLSYFMLADEITVDTCRLGRDGQPGQRLRVSIAGPGSLFRIQSLGPGTESGTAVRLHLRGGAVSCVQTLREVLWVADFRTEAFDGTQRQVWRPGELSDATGPARAASKAVTGAGIVADTTAGVWWCTGDGAILADGLWAGQELTGAVVNLRRDLAPRLSVDRTKILAYRDEDVEKLLWRAIPALVAAGPAVLTYEWLYTFTYSRPLIADVIFDQAIASGYTRWELGGEPVDASIVGCFNSDGGGLGGPDELVEWRLTALAAAGLHAKLVSPAPQWRHAVRARPSDALLVSRDIDGTAPWLDPVETVPLSHLVRASRRIGRGSSELAARLEQLGYNVATGFETLVIEPDDLTFISRDLDGTRPWLDPADPVRLPHVLKATHRAARPLRQVLARLVRLGFSVEIDLDTLPIEELDPADLIMASRDLDGSYPWLDEKEPVPLLHMVRAAHRLERDASAVAARLAALGYPLAAGCEALRTEPDDLVLASRDLDGASPWLEHAEPVTPVHLLRCAERTGRSVADIAARLASFGFSIGADPEQIAEVKLSQDDLVIASHDLEGGPPWLAADRPVTILHLLRAAEAASEPLASVAARLSRLGYRPAVRPEEVIVDHLDSDDTTMASVDLDGAQPWLAIDKPVPVIHLLRAARVVGRDLHDVAARLTLFGYQASTDLGELGVDQLTRDDLVITSQDLDGSDPWLDPAEKVLLPHLLQAARRTRRAPQEVAARLGQLGYPVDVDLSGIPVKEIRSADLTYASTDLDGSRPWLDPAETVSLAHLLAAANKLRRPVSEIATRLELLGYHVPDLDVRLPRSRPGGA